MTDDLIELLQALDAPQLTYRRLDKYFHGDSPLSFLSREAKVALRNFEQITSNLCRTAVVSLQERLRLSGMSGAWDLFEYSDLDQLSSDAHRSALLYGWCPILCWTDANGKPRATVESPKEVCVARDPVSRDIVKAAKRVRTKDATLVWLYYPDRVEHWKSNSPSSGNTGFVLVETVPHSLGVVPIAVIGHEDETSVITDLLTIQDGINKLLSDMLVASEYAGRPRRFASGIELQRAPKLDSEGNVVTDPDTGEVITEPQNPFTENNRMMIAEKPEARFGSIAAADLKTFEAGIRVLISQAMMVSGLPAHYVGLLQESVTSADALRAAEAALVARAEAKQRTYGVGWEAVGRLLIAIRDGVDASSVVARARWSPADTRSEAQTADAALKLFTAGILSHRTTLQRLGFTEAEADAEILEIDNNLLRQWKLTLARLAFPLNRPSEAHTALVITIGEDMTQPVTDPTADPVEVDDEQTEHQGDETIVYKRADLTKLRTEAKDNRVRAEAAEARTEELSRQLFAAKVTALGKLADPTDLEYSADLLEDDALNAAVDELLTRRPHYAARKVSGTVGQGITGQQEQPFSMMGRLQQSA